MATAAAIEVIIRARDEASATVAAAMGKMAGEAQRLQGAVAGIGGAGTAGALAGLAGAFGEGGSAASGMLTTVQLLTAGMPLLAAGTTVAASAIGGWIAQIDEAAKKQVAWNEAVAGFSAAPFVSEVKKIDQELALHADRAKTFGGTLMNLWQDLRVNPRIDQARDEREANVREANLRAEIAGQHALNQTLATKAQLEATIADNRARAARAAGDPAAAAAAEAEAAAAAARALQTRLDNINAQERRTLAETPRGIDPQTVTQNFAEQRIVARMQAQQAATQRQEAAAKQLETIEARAQREREQQARETVQIQTAAAEEVTQAWRQSVQTRDRMERELVAAQRELGAARRARYEETVGQLPALQAQQQRLAALPNQPAAAQIRALDLGAELASLQAEAAALQKEDRRRGIEEREQLAQERVDALSTGFQQATQQADALTAKVKELGGALKDLQVSPGFAAKLSQDLADTLTFLGARSP